MFTALGDDEGLLMAQRVGAKRYRRSARGRVVPAPL
jgi:hypothetical protein